MAEEAWSWARRMAQGVVSGGVALGWSGAETISFLREVGWGYRTQDVYEDIRSYSGRTKWEYQITRLDPTSVVPRSWMAETSKEIWHEKETYKVVGYAGYWSEEEKQFIDQYMTIYLHREMTMGEISAFVVESPRWEGYEGKKDVIGWETIGMMHLEGAGY